MTQRLSRRRVVGLFSAGVALVAVAPIVAACGATATQTSPPKTPAPASAQPAAAPPAKPAASTRKLAFGVGPLLPTPDDTKRAWDPFFKYLAERLDAPGYDLAATTDWAGIAVAMGAGQVDVAWMGPWGYVLARNATDCFPVATAKYDEKPIYHAIIIAAPDTKIARFPDDSKGMSMSFADLGSTSGWLIPTYYAKEVWKIDPKTHWKYSEGATHAANEIAVAERQVELATDFDRNRNAMIDGGKIKPDGTKVVWTSDPLPNDAIALPKTAAADLAEQIKKIVIDITVNQAKTLLPARYTGFVPATHETYRQIEDAGIAVGKIKAK